MKCWIKDLIKKKKRSDVAFEYAILFASLDISAYHAKKKIFMFQIGHRVIYIFCFCYESLNNNDTNFLSPHDTE